jgi:hypothetical protein
MPDTFLYPTNRELEEIVQDLTPTLEAGRKLLALCPYEYQDTAEIVWEQEDNFYGLMNVRGLNGKPGNVQRVGAKQYKMAPGYYGDFHNLTEDEMTVTRKTGTLGDVVDIEDLTVRRMRHLIVRRLNRCEQTISALFRTGVFQNYAADGTAVHTDVVNITRRTPGTTWSTLNTSTPLQDLRTWKASGEMNTSSRFGKDSTLIGTTQTINYLLNNTNAADLGGKRMEVGQTINSLAGLNALLAANDLPQLEEYNDVFDPSSPFIPHGSLIWVGTRPQGGRVASFCGTRNINTGAGESNQGIYSKVIDTMEREVPRRIEIHHGFNGGIKLMFPSAIQSISFSI